MRAFSRIPCCFLATAFLLACADGDNNNNVIPVPTPEPPASMFSQTTIDIPSKATPAFTPGTPGVVVENDKLLRQFGSAEINLNKARYTRYFLSDKDGTQPDAIIVLVPGFEAGAAIFSPLAENLLLRAATQGSMVLEVWIFERRSNQLEDRVGLDIAEDLKDPMVGLDFLFGDALGLELSQALVDGPNRRVIFYNSNEDTAFMAQWTPLVHSLDIDAVVEAARSTARSGNVYLGGHSAGTGFAARYAATDFNLAGGEPDPGYSKLRGLILLEGGGASQLSASLDEETLDKIEARFDGGLYGAVRDQLPRCIDGLTACTAATDCQAFANTSCQPVSAFTELSFLTTEMFAAAEVTALDASLHDDSTLALLQRDIDDIPGNSAIEKVPELNILNLLLGDTPASSITLLGKFLDDDGLAAALASFFATSWGFEGPVVNGVRTWLSKGEPMPAEALVDNGPAPQTLADGRRPWGLEVEPSDLEGRMLPPWFRGDTNVVDWYYPSSGLGVTAGLGLDTTPLSAPPPLGRGRSDIDNRTQGAAINIPVIGFGGSNGLTPVPGAFLGFADAIATCSAPGCDGTTPRVLDRANPNEAFPTFGGVSGGYEVYISEGYSHVDVVTADDDEGNLVISRLLDFVERNLR